MHPCFHWQPNHFFFCRKGLVNGPFEVCSCGSDLRLYFSRLFYLNSLVKDQSHLSALDRSWSCIFLHGNSLDNIFPGIWYWQTVVLAFGDFWSLSLVQCKLWMLLQAAFPTVAYADFLHSPFRLVRSTPLRRFDISMNPCGSSTALNQSQTEPDMADMTRHCSGVLAQRDWTFLSLISRSSRCHPVMGVDLDFLYVSASFLGMQEKDQEKGTTRATSRLSSLRGIVVDDWGNALAGRGTVWRYMKWFQEIKLHKERSRWFGQPWSQQNLKRRMHGRKRDEKSKQDEKLLISLKHYGDLRRWWLKWRQRRMSLIFFDAYTAKIQWSGASRSLLADPLYSTGFVANITR